MFRRMRLGGDDGVALIVAIALVGLATVIMTTMVSIAVHEGNATGRDRQRSSSVTSAEGAVDQTSASIENPASGVFPCGVQPAVQVTTAKPDTMSITTTVAYYDASGATLACPLTASTSASVAQAFVTSTSTSNSLAGGAPAKRQFSSLLRLKPVYANALPSAVFGQTLVTPFQSMTIHNNGAVAADVYSNGDVGCVSTGGSIYAQGSINLGSCTVDVDAWAVNTVQSSTRVSGNVRVSSATGTASLSGTVGGKVYVNKTNGVSPSGFCTPATKCVQGPGSTTAPPLQTFPVLNWNATTSAAWAANGYTVLPDFTNCATASSWIQSNASTLAGPTLVRANCTTPIDLNFSMRLNNNLAIFADGGFYAKNGADLGSTTTTVHNLHLIQPNNSPLNVSPTCSTAGVDFKNNASTQYANVVMYSPCDITFKNNSQVYGQIYSGGKVDFMNNTDVYYRQVPTYGLSSGSVASFDVDVLYKREDLNS